MESNETTGGKGMDPNLIITPDQIFYLQILRTVEIWQRIITIVLGSIGNCLSVVIFCSTNLRTLSSSYYLSALALSDTAFLLVLFLNWLQDIGFSIYLQSVFCRIQIYLTQTFGFLSVWFVVAFTVERFIAVQYPLLRPSMCTVSRAKKVITGLTLLGLCLYLPFLAVQADLRILEDMDKPSCQSTVTPIANMLNTVDTVITMLIPCVAIVCVNTCICVTVSRLSRRRRRMTINSGRRLTESSRSQNSSNRVNYSQNKVTRLLLVVSTVFVGLNIPNYVFRLFYYLPENQVAIFSSRTKRYVLRLRRGNYMTLSLENSAVCFRQEIGNLKSSSTIHTLKYVFKEVLNNT